MRKQLPFSLRNFIPEPPPLAGRTEVPLYLRRLFHHMYLDHFYSTPPSPNPFFNLYQHQLTNSTLFEFKENGLGCNKEARVGESNKFGKALLRWFLARYCGVTHFAHVDRILKLQTNPNFRRVTLSRADKGDLPDFLCANSNSKQIFLGEAKGRLSNFTFDSSKFITWRDQFDRVEVKAANGRIISLKGYIVATRIRRRGISGNWSSTLYCEDPKTPGELPNREESTTLTSLICELHYGGVFEKLGFPMAANALLQSQIWDAQTRVTAGVWKLLDDPLKDVEFVGISLSNRHSNQFCPRPLATNQAPKNPRIEKGQKHPELFFGLRLSVFKQVISLARTNPDARSPIETVAIDPEEVDASPLSYESDGTLLCDSNSVEFQGFVEF